MCSVKTACGGEIKVTKKGGIMAILSDEAVTKAREFAEKLGWFTLSGDVREHSQLIPSLWRIHFVGDYQDFEIDVDTETGKILHWHCQSPLQIAINKAAHLSKVEEEGKPTNIIKVIAEEHDRAYQKWKEREVVQAITPRT